ncbi:MAG: radical SAM protein [Candidatus Omnitrophica bacterium]|nr:radical SAM protein [Candidatus Omnitrophota bacterium]
MKIVLLNPPMSFEAALGKAKDIGKYTVMIPHGLASMAAVLRENNIRCNVMDAYAENLSIKEIVARISEHKPSIVGISAVTPVINIVHSIASEIKKNNPSVRIVLGGPHPSILPGEVLNDPNVDFVITGEGEYAFLDLARALDKNSDVGSIPGVSYRKSGSTIHNKPATYIKDLDALPPPAYDMLPMDLYTTPPQWSLASPSYQLIATRGCPYACGFCRVGLGEEVRYKSAGRVCDEIEYLIEHHDCKQIVFVDTTFPFNLKHAEQVCNEMISRGLNKKIVWFTSTRVDIVNQHMLDLMYKAGCRLVTFGIESGNQHILDSINKRITLKQAEKAVAMAHKAKINVTASYILGLPGEDRRSILNTIRFAKRLNTLYAQFNIIVPYPGTKVFDYAVRNNLLRHRNWDSYVSLTSLTDLEPPFVAEGLDKEELLGLQRKAYNNYYLSPRLIMKHLKKVIVNREFKKYFTLTRILFDTFK